MGSLRHFVGAVRGVRCPGGRLRPPRFRSTPDRQGRHDRNRLERWTVDDERKALLDVLAGAKWGEDDKPVSMGVRSPCG